MISTIYFYNQTLLKTYEIWDIITYRVLPSKTKAQVLTTQNFP